MSSADSAYTSAESESSEVRINTPKNEPQVHCPVHQPTPQQQQQQPPPRRWQTEDAQIRAEEEERHRQLLGLLRRMKASMAAMNEQIRSKPALEPLPLPKQEETMLFTVEPLPGDKMRLTRMIKRRRDEDVIPVRMEESGEAGFFQVCD